LAEGNGPEAVEGAAPKTRSEPAGAVFISYASQDAAAAQRIAAALRAAGIEVWFDQSELRGGDAWDQSIRKQIKTCALFLPIVSRNTHERDEGYFRLEWKLAVDRCHSMAADKAFLLPVLIDDTRADDERVPERFREVQWMRLSGEGIPPTLVERVQRLLSGELLHAPTSIVSEPARVSAAPTAGQRAPVSWPAKAALILAIAGVLVALVYLVAIRLPLSKRGGQTESASPASAAQAVPATAFNPPPHSIAVLPFVNMSGDPKQDYFSDGVSEELLNVLSRLNELQVVARTSSFSFKGKDVDVSVIARQLNVSAVLEGSVRRAGNTVRITVQLINAASGYHIWSQTYDRKLTDILKVQSDVATSVAQRLKVQLVSDELEKLEVGGTKNPEAYDAYLRGKQLLLRGDTDEAGDIANIVAFDEAIKLDPGYALAYAGRASAVGNFAIFNAKPGERADLREQARAAAERAVALAPDIGETHIVLAQIRALLLLDYAGAAPEFERALALKPGSAQVQSAFAAFSSLLGQHEPAVEAARRAVLLNPLDVGVHIMLGQCLLEARRYKEALGVLEGAKSLSPGSHYVQSLITEALLASGRVQQAQQLCESRTTPIDEDFRHHCLALAYHALGRQADASEELERLRTLNGDASAYGFAEIYAQWGDKSKSLQWLGTAEQLRAPSLQLLRVDWQLDPIRNEPVFKSIEARTIVAP
jgi:TolB-like protein/Tfp pilus assembly protein PilF